MAAEAQETKNARTIGSISSWLASSSNIRPQVDANEPWVPAGVAGRPPSSSSTHPGHELPARSPFDPVAARLAYERGLVSSLRLIGHDVRTPSDISHLPDGTSRFKLKRLPPNILDSSELQMLSFLPHLF
ncbi:uncharacterized protein FOMMEDRAFT_164552 [Fomitiporia mediterranea MF3/22]|uniref:uncharacterized protein n=1 Tax=Fomitiporia mediterranea (strain MF3/22) TaxID=694068 RepID=UPI00044074B6|nr:uncharacterized protein FOMMEDRAFT_164552 [Fomitiporia mediterranea MF3/22]EJD07626.1 hypothetical protein FOMMEDRAFT_164552 [Fomitiporia mediterranea MF3/22]